MNKVTQILVPAVLRTKISQYPMLTKIIVNVWWLFAERALNIASSLIVGAIVARYLGPAQLGLLSYAQSVVLLFLAVTTLGLDHLIVRSLVRGDAPEERILGTTLVFRLGASLMVLGLVAAIVWQIQEDALTRMLVLLAASGLMFDSTFNTIALWFQAKVLSKYIVWAKNVSLVIIAALRLTSVALEAPLIVFALLAFAQYILYAFGFIFVLHRQGNYIRRWRFDWQLGLRLLRSSWPLIISGLAASAFMRIDQVMLESMVNTSAVGVYAAAVRLSELWYFIPTALAGSLFPAIISSKERHTNETYQIRLQAFYDLMVGVSVIIAIGITLLAEPVIQVLFGEAYSGSIIVLRIHTWTLIFVAIGVARAHFLLAENMTRLLMTLDVIGAVSNILLNFWLIPQYGAVGAALATLLTYFISSYLTLLVDRRLWLTFKQVTLSFLLPFRIVSVVRLFRRVIKSSQIAGES